MSMSPNSYIYKSLSVIDSFVHKRAKSCPYAWWAYCNAKSCPMWTCSNAKSAAATSDLRMLPMCCPMLIFLLKVQSAAAQFITNNLCLLLLPEEFPAAVWIYCYSLLSITPRLFHTSVKILFKLLLVAAKNYLQTIVICSIKKGWSLNFYLSGSPVLHLISDFCLLALLTFSVTSGC